MSAGGVSVVDDISRQIGKLEGNVEALTQGVSELRAENARDHAEVIAALKEVNVKLDAKADNIRVNNHALRIDSLEQTRDQEEGAKERGHRLERRASLYLAVLSTVVGAVIGVLSVLAATGNL